MVSHGSLKHSLENAAVEQNLILHANHKRSSRSLIEYVGPLLAQLTSVRPLHEISELCFL